MQALRALFPQGSARSRRFVPLRLRSVLRPRVRRRPRSQVRQAARYCPKPGADDKDRRDCLLENIRKCGAPRPWKARFVCEIAIVFPEENNTLKAAGYCEGEIIPEERGSNGFGYDPVFYRPDLGKMLAELTEDEKNAISHRGNAIKKAKPFLVRSEE